MGQPKREPQWTPLLSRPLLTVTELNRLVKDTLETELDAAWVVAEISNFRVPPSGHFYFTLKDEKSQIAAVMFRRQGQMLSFQPENGMEVLCFGRVSVYPVRGDLQLYVETLEPRGRGALQLALEQLKKKLWAEGLFAAERKRPLPLLPQSVGIVTSTQGAAIRDILRILSDRFPDRRVVIRPVKVQGDGSALEIAAAIEELGGSGEVEVLIVGRGGGSLEDLWSFNEESVARAIFACPVPVISAVGHEVDFTIADLVADHRAPTPSAAAEMAVPEKNQLLGDISRLENRLARCMQSNLGRARQSWGRLARRLADPRRRLRERQVRVDELSMALWRRMRNSFERCRERVGYVSGRLNGVSPLAVLDRGYSIAQKMPEGAVVKDSEQLEVGDVLKLRFARGGALCRVERKE
jgi:exodeoxyribonuclease VII large subunit